MKRLLYILFLFPYFSHALDITQPINFVDRKAFVTSLKNLEKQFEQAVIKEEKEKIAYDIAAILTILHQLAISSPYNLQEKIENIFEIVKDKETIKRFKEHLEILKDLVNKSFLQLILPGTVVGKGVGLKALSKNERAQELFNNYLTYCIVFSSFGLFDNFFSNDPHDDPSFDLKFKNFILRVAEVVKQSFMIYHLLPLTVLEELNNPTSSFYEKNLLFASKKFFNEVLSLYQNRLKTSLSPFTSSVGEEVRIKSYSQLLQSLINERRGEANYRQLSFDLLFLQSVI